MTGGHQSHQNDLEDEIRIKEYYMGEIGDVKSIYDDKDGKNTNDIQDSQFKYMMIRHSCLFLLQMFVFLGLGVGKLKPAVSELPDHPGHSDHEILFGRDDKDFESREIMFYKSVVFPGNQIPLVVLHKLMEQSFFKNIVLRENWKKPSSSDLVRSALYDLILDPVLKKNRSSSDAQTAWTWLQGVFKKLLIRGQENECNSTQEQHVEKITDILQGLHYRLVGTARGDIVGDRSQNGTVDLEASNNSNYLDPQHDEGERIPSATEMHSKGIDFKGVSGMAIREICIKDSMFIWKVLHLPVFTFSEMTKDMYSALKVYEDDQGPKEREVSAYFRFLCDIVRNDQDAALLAEKGIIKVDGHKFRIDEVAVYLKNLARAGAPGDKLLLPLTSNNLRRVKLDIIQYHLKPWYSKYVSTALLLSFFSLFVSIVSATFTILNYFLHRKK